MDSMTEIAAINVEAKRRGTSYGKLVAAISWDEMREIVRKYGKSKEAKERRAGRKKEAAH